ncbi:MAG: putative bifunctional diguanylate cyclase/phosphodiesterase [Devosia sp.]
MFAPARKSMPAIDYVSAVAAVYKDRRAMVMGALLCIVGASASAFKTGSPWLWAVAIGFALVCAGRFFAMAAFQRANIAADDVEAAYGWEVQATWWSTAFAALAGIWCFTSFVFVNDAVSELIAMTTTVGCMVGIVTRNFGLDRMLSIQIIVATVFLAAGLFLKGDAYHWLLACMLLPTLISFRFLAADVRAVLLAAVHSRLEATRLAGELDTALDTMQHGLCMLDEHGIVAVANDRVMGVFASLAPGEWNGQPFATMIATAAELGSIPRRSADQLLETVSAGDGGKVVLKLSDGQYCEVTVSSRLDKTVLLFEDITERVKAEERINYMAHYDTLTGLPNRAYFTEQVQADLERRRRTRLVPGRADDMAMLMIVDVDDFKHVNDTMGHLIGDRVLIETSERLTRVLGKDSLVARLGGDEYVVYRASGVTAADIVNDPEAILAGFREAFEVEGEVFSVHVSVGIVTVTDGNDDLDALMIKADLALYKAKALGKGRSQVFHDEMDTDYRYRQRLKTDLKQAVADNKLSLVFQPIVDLKSRRVVSCEALARWHHPELGSIPPSLFIPIAEETGIVSDITRWVLAAASTECINWPDEVSVSVNISARDFRNADVAQMVKNALKVSGLAPHRLEIEVTETAVIEERDAATTILQNLARQGIGIALDDFGTGYSSLSYLQALPFTKLKIDRSFVMDIAENPRSLKLLTNVAQLGKDINLTVTAEGVETEDQLDLISRHSKVDQIQGYLFGVPLPRREVAELIDRMAANAPVQRVLTVAGANRKRG